MSHADRKSLERQMFDRFLRTGEGLPDGKREVERKFNPNHDPDNGRFTFALGNAGGKISGWMRNGSGRVVMETQVTRSPVSSAPSGGRPLASSSVVAVAQIRLIMPTSGGHADDYIDALNAGMAAHGITSREQQAAFLAQIKVESDSLRSTSENLNYSAKRIHQVWPNRFPTVAAAQPYAHNPVALANRVYANRLGNGNEASGDGFRYRGRGLMQVTGRSNYRDAGFENNPDDLTDPVIAVNSAASFWKKRQLNRLSQTVLNRAQFNAISRIVNGGSHGSDDRWAAYQRALAVLRP